MYNTEVRKKRFIRSNDRNDDNNNDSVSYFKVRRSLPVRK